MEHNTFHYTYSAKEQAEVESIRKKYVAPPAEDKLTQLRRLDAGVTRKATTVSLILGVLGTLLLGSGMSLIMTDLAALLTLPTLTAMGIGIGLGLFGILLTCLAYPVYNRIVKNERQKIAPQILSLTDDLLK